MMCICCAVSRGYIKCATHCCSAGFWEQDDEEQNPHCWLCPKHRHAELLWVKSTIVLGWMPWLRGSLQSWTAFTHSQWQAQIQHMHDWRNALSRSPPAEEDCKDTGRLGGCRRAPFPISIQNSDIIVLTLKHGRGTVPMQTVADLFELGRLDSDIANQKVAIKRGVACGARMRKDAVRQLFRSKERKAKLECQIVDVLLSLPCLCL